MEILDATVIAPAAPHIADEFGVPAVSLNVAITAYVLSLVVLRTTSKAELVKAIAYLTWPALIAPVIAPALGGLLSTYASWRWILVINVPLGLVGIVLARRLVPDVRGARATGLDWRGFALTAVGVAALVVGLEGVGVDEPNWVVVASALAIAAIALVAAVPYLLSAGDDVVWRPTLNPVWTPAIGVGNMPEATVNVSKDDVVFGVRAVRHDGHRSPAVFPSPTL